MGFRGYAENERLISEMIIANHRRAQELEFARFKARKQIENRLEGQAKEEFIAKCNAEDDARMNYEREERRHRELCESIRSTKFSLFC